MATLTQSPPWLHVETALPNQRCRVSFCSVARLDYAAFAILYFAVLDDVKTGVFLPRACRAMALIRKKCLHRRSSEGMWREDALALNAIFKQFDEFSITIDFPDLARRWWRGLDGFLLRDHRVRQLCKE